MEITNDTTNNEISTDQATIATFTCNIIPDKVSYLENDAGYITKADVPTKVSELENDTGYITEDEVPRNLSEYNNDVPFAKISELPTKVSELENDSKYMDPIKVKAGNNISTDYTEDTVTINAGDPLPNQEGKENKLSFKGTK